MTVEFVVSTAIETVIFMIAVFLWVGWGVLSKLFSDSQPTVRLVAWIYGLILIGVTFGLAYAFTVS